MNSNNLWDRIYDATKGKKYMYVPLNQGEALQSDRSYIRIFIAEMFLESRFAWFKTWYPAVSVGVKLQFGDRPTTIISRVARPPEDAIKGGVLRNFQILPLTPFNGGTVEVQAALLAMEGANYLGTTIDVLQDFSSLVAPPLALALTVAEKVSNGLDHIMEATNGKARLPYHDTFVGQGMGGTELKPGYLAIIRAEEDEIDSAGLFVKEGKLLYTPSGGGEAEPFRSVDYVLLRFDGPSTRDDYRQLSSIATPYDEFLQALEKGDFETAIAAEKALRIAVLRCDDLARFDRPRVWDAISKEIEEFKMVFGINIKGAKAAASPALRNLDDIMAKWAIPMSAVQLTETGAIQIDKSDLKHNGLGELERMLERSLASQKSTLGQSKSAATESSLLLDDEFDFIDSEPIIEEIQERERVIYGEDRRMDLYESEVLNNESIMADADSVVSLWNASDLIDNGNGTFTLRVESFKESYTLCEDENFADQPKGAYCSGVLLAPDIVGTAGHCLHKFKQSSPRLEDIRIVFGFRMKNVEEAVIEVDNSEVYQAVELLNGTKDGSGRDWAVIRLDRPVPNHGIASLRRQGTISEGTPVHIIGHPCGLPAKYAPEAEVRDNSPDSYFVANLDSFGGNSGSPVFNSETHEVEGLLVRGAPDFLDRGGCYVSNVCPQIDGTRTCKGEDVTRSSEFSEFVPEVGE